MLRGVCCIAGPHGLQGSNGGVQPGHVLAERTTGLDRRAVLLTHWIGPTAQGKGHTVGHTIVTVGAG